MPRVPSCGLTLCLFSLTGALSTGCRTGGVLTRTNEFRVVSQPPGAVVYAAGKRIGVTPLTVRQQEVFPVTYEPAQQDLYGTLLLTKDGCKDHTVKVSNLTIQKGVDAKLDCGQAELAKPQSGTPGAPPLSIKERLLRLNELREQGLITEEEYREIRAAILRDL